MNNNGLVYDVHDRPSFGKMVVFALQQVLAIMAATIAVPTIIGLPMQIPAALLGAGISVARLPSSEVWVRRLPTGI